MFLTVVTVQAQIVIGGNVYGGGNAGNTGGKTTVTVHAGDIHQVYGGARQANVAGSAFVHIDGAHASSYIIVDKLFGGNDIAGTIGTSATVPAELTDAAADGVNKTWNAFIRISDNATHTQQTYIGQLFGGGNGDYDYTSQDYAGLVAPTLAKTYLDIHGGSIVYAYGGGNAATVTDSTVICVNNPSTVVSSIKDVANPNADVSDPNAESYGELLTDNRFQNLMGINTGFSYPSSDAFQIGRFFGGNNKAEMAIRPTWKLERGLIRNLYSGGNQGAMTHPMGILLTLNSPDMKVDNVYGGCRMANVNPAQNNIEEETIEGVTFPAGYAARVLVTAGDINNVYGGNDITGIVYGGNAVGIHSSIKGNVYGGGNGSYPYTDKPEYVGHDIYGDIYYNPGSNSVAALKEFRPNAESVSIRVVGTDADHPTVIGGAIYCGGNSATLHTDDPTKNVAAELKIGSYVIADKVFLGNNGENMVTDNILTTMKTVNSIDLTNSANFKGYMDAVAMDIKPRVVFDPGYQEYSTKFGSFYCGGNVGSMMFNGAETLNFNDKVIIFDKLVGGSNDANVYAKDGLNAEYLGGLLGDPDANGNKLTLNFNGLKIQPMRWKVQRDNDYNIVKDANNEVIYESDTYGNRILEWNTISASTGKDVAPVTDNSAFDATKDLDRRFKGGNIYGGCYNTGHVNGNVIINLNASLEDRKGPDAIFDQVEQNEGEAILYGNDSYNILQRRSGVLLDKQGMDVLGKALNVFGGGYGEESEIWGSTTINLNAGYTFQIFGGGEKGAIGHGTYNQTKGKLEYNTYDPKYSCYVNLKGSSEGVYRGHTDDSNEMAEAEFIYGGSFEAPIAGNTVINLGNGRIFNSFAGSCNADILGHTETYIGRSGVDANGNDILGFPWIRDHVYGGNVLVKRIMTTENFKDRVSADIQNKVYNPKAEETPLVTSASAYMEYIQGRVENIYGGCYGVYDYKDRYFSDYTDDNGLAKGAFTKPRMVSAFINFKPIDHTRNAAKRIYGAGQGYSGDSDRDVMQDRSYVLIDIPKDDQRFQAMEVFGAGDYCGLGMRDEVALGTMPALNPTMAKANADGVTASAVVDLFRGQIGAAYGASYNEGITRRAIVNVPEGSTIRIGSIFGGAYGSNAYKPCDVYEAHVNYLTQSEDAYLIYNPSSNLTKGAIYGGNNYARRTLYGQINISAPVRQSHPQYGMTTATVYGAGCGSLTWNEYTEVNLNDGAKVWEVYGGGEAGSVMNAKSVQAYINLNPNGLTDADWFNAWSLGKGYDPEIANKTPLESLKEGYADNTPTNLDNDLVRVAEMDDRTTKTYRYNTNVIINKGAYVGNYAYGGGLGNANDAFVGSGDVYGTTYIALLGGTVNKDLYAAGTSGAVYNLFGAENLTASATAYIEGGAVRNVYGGGWKGSVGHHTGALSASADNDIPGETHVVIGIRKDRTEALPSDYGFYDGVPAIQRNAYGGGEGGSVYGTTHLTLNNGYIGYIYNTDNNQYEEKLHDETWTDHVGTDRLSDCGNLFGGGYDDNSSVDESHVVMMGGIVRNSVFGGGEIATIGRGATQESGEDNKERVLKDIYKDGKTHIEMYNGHVKRNVFGGGKGYNILGYGGVHGFYTDGYVFGKTEVHIHGGEIGTDEGLAEGYGNVFGGGDVGFVYSGSYLTGTHTEGTGSPNHYYYKNAAGNLTEDCKVVIAPMLQVKKNGTTVTFNEETYGPYDYVPTDYLNTLPAEKTDAGWTNLYTGEKLPNGAVNPDDPEERGIHIHNAVFAGGNVSSNSESYSNATTVFGNTTATLYDVYHHDFITVGTEHTGGLYGGGNLSLVGGYRELNITNYGTDYYGLDQQISLEEYQKLTNRERAYFKLEYLCQQDVTIGGKNYKQGDRITEDEYNALPANYKNTTYWVQYGFCSIYAGRLLNTIQRADFCGVYGSRLVLQGAKDRVADVADATEYTINRIGEVSLNQQRSVIPSDLTLKAGVTPKANPNDYNPEDYENWQKAIHGNYFGIYSGVNYLGALTSDVHFDDPRRYVDKGQTYVDNANTYYHWKEDHLQKRDRNNGTALNQLALASGVYLELTTENSTPSNKKYGTITGIIELDLINIKKDIEGGGYVYARNEHGARTYHDDYQNVLLSEYNKQKIVGGQEWRDEARTHKRYTYSESNLQEMQTSGNFIHKSKRIVDDCYPNNGIYNDGYTKSPAHYWFIKGEVYIYDQIVSAYAGSASAYSKEVKIPLTITAGSNGKLKLLNVQPNLYAYYGDETRTSKMGSDGVKVDNESMTYKLNDVITWWDWHQLADNEQKYFVKETLVNVDPCTIDGTPYEAGTYVLENDKSIHTTTAWDTFQTAGHAVKDAKGDNVTDLSKLFRSSNNISHETGYVLTLDMNSPKDWDDWYSPVLRTDGDKIRKDAYEELSDANKSKYREGPTYTLTGASGLYGQRAYSVGEIITKEVYDDYTSTVGRMPQQPSGQATVDPAYVALADLGNIQAGNAISKTEYDALPDKSNFAAAMVCINSIQVGDEEYVLLGELVSGTDASLEALAQKYKTYNNSMINADQIDDAQALAYVKSNLSNAYYIKTEGLYGGQYYEAGQNYGAIKSWSTLTDDRNKFAFNYDAFDVLVDSSYPGEGHTSVYHSPYDVVKSVEYVAAYNGTGTLTYYDNDNTQHTISAGGTIDREAFEKVRNDQMHYTRISVPQGSDKLTVYVVNETLINNGVPYAKGQDISEKDYKSLSTENKAKVDVVEFQKGSAEAVKYYCYEDYTPSSSFNVEAGTAGQKGSVISATIFNDNTLIPNYQNQFSIQGSEPTETTTLYVSRESNAKDVTKEKVISVVYQYTYYEADDEGEGVSLVNELHVLNIHLQLESGAPEIGLLNTPPAVLPGNAVGLKAPTVNPGLYEILTSGWELFNSEEDAMLHRNGVPFTNNSTPLYWYQNQKVWLAFFSKTYLGKTYSNYVPLTVANYHDLDAVMNDKEHHLYVDHPGVARNSKIYIDNRTCESDATKSELDLLKDFFDLSVSGLAGHASLDTHVKGGADLEFILNSNVSPKAYTNWTPIGDATTCFSGNLHGDGNTVSGLNNSLFGNLCGSVYNLGVTGSFTSAGVADTGDGYVESCWINTTGTPDGSVRAVFGNPTRGSQTQIANCYYPVTKAYNATNNGRGLAHPMSETDFYNGTVAYNLNGFYLNKRYYDHAALTSGTEYKYLKDENGTLTENLQTGYYPENPEGQYGYVGYVERRYTDGDFIYAGGTVPEAYDERMRVINDGSQTSITYAPIWPDDYIFFGQSLTYGYNPTVSHQALPSRVVKSSGRLPVSTTSNRVYRAPAYYRNDTQDVAHFNLSAYLAAYSKPKTLTDTDLDEAYPNMTAIDFAGHNDNNWALGSTSSGDFYPPLLDNADGLISISNEGETPNLLVYAPSATANSSTYNVLSSYFTEPAYADYYQGGSYRIVTAAPTGGVHGHLVTSDKLTLSDHLLVDKRDFYCPIGYTMGEGKRMWHQRTPDSYANVTKGWETVSLPFTAELVTTQQKGEITHFYSGSRTMENSDAKIGHEYWLREYKDKKAEDNQTVVAIFDYPAASGATKNASNTFLWDYYYKANSQADANADSYQTYYNSTRTLAQYPLLTGGTPYIIGFPGKTYREFDLSGTFEPQHTATTAPAKLDRQVITFASEAGVAINGSASEMAGVSKGGYTFKPNYLNQDVTGFLMNADGDKFAKATTPAAVVPFRPYFVAATANGAPRRVEAQNIVFDTADSSFAIGDEDPSDELAGELTFSTKPRKLVTTSSLRYAANVRVFSTSGQSIASFTIQPGETVETDITIAGVYIVRADNGRYTKKFALK